MLSSVFLVSILIAGAPPGAGRDVPVPASDSFATSWDQTHFEHNLWSAVLARHVDESGLVDYAAIKKDDRFREYLYRLANTSPVGLADDGSPAGDPRLAFWINAYNALVIQGVLETLPADSTRWKQYSVLEVDVPGVARRGKGFFVGLRFKVGQRRYNLDEIEKAVLLQGPPRDSGKVDLYRSVGPKKPDARVHFALVCAAKGCPKLWTKSYDGASIDRQLDQAARRFVRDPKRTVFDLTGRTVNVSQLADWYKEDFTSPGMSGHAGSVIEFLSRYVDDGELARSLSEEAWRIAYLDYDWKLNVR